MLYGDFQLKSSEVGLTKAGLTVTLQKYWLRKYNIYTRVSKTKAKNPPPPPRQKISSSKDIVNIIYVQENPKQKLRAPPPQPPALVKRYLQEKIK